MKKVLALALAIFMFTALPPIHSSAQQAPVELLVGAAMSLRDVTVDLAAEFEAANQNVTLSFTYASSGAL